MALHDFPPGDESDAPLLDESGFQQAGSGFDPSSLKPRFTLRTVVCPYCQDRGFLVVRDVPFDVEPCPACRRGEQALKGWWSKRKRPGRGGGTEPNQRLVANAERDA